ncbi:MAG TPA: Ig-like domain-containing protein [Flavobacteriales bacterium]|nr:Ig-like domain-containing protein [Flavobacteriales bacterium]
MARIIHSFIFRSFTLTGYFGQTHARQLLPAAAIFFLITIVITSCAQMGEPTGGERDDRAPETIQEKTFPANQSVNFNSDKVIITFSEYVQLKNPQVSITPAMDKKPTMKARGKRIEITLHEKPAPNTTYTINLSDAISDITENNPVKNFQYVFSTGPYLDSLSISGKVLNAFTQNGISSATVILHSTDTDSAILREKPAYFLKTERDGSFKFSNLKQGRYRMYALNDKNADLLFSGYPEEIGFMDSAIDLTRNVAEVKLRQFKPLPAKAKLSSTASISKWIQKFSYTRTLSNLDIRALKGIEASKLVLLKTKPTDSVFMVFMSDTLVKDTVSFELLSNNSVVDTLNFTSHLNRKMTSRASFKLNATGEVYVNDSIFISSNMPFGYDRSKISITDTLHKSDVKFTVKETPLGLKLFPQKLTEKVPLKFVALPGAFISTLSGAKSDTLKATTTYLPEEKTGSIELKFQGLMELYYEIPTVVLLLDGKFLRQKRLDYNEKKAEFNLLKPGNYTFYIYDDVNSDDTWTPGNFNEKQQPEKIKWYTQPVKVKANWQQDLTWIL